MKNLLTLFLGIPFLLLVMACTKDKSTVLAQNEARVILIDFNSSCNEDLLLIEPPTIFDQLNQTDNTFLYSDIANHSKFKEMEFGDTLLIEYELFPEADYHQRFAYCIRVGGVLVKIVKIK